MDQTFRDMLEASTDIVAQMPPEVREALDEIVGGVARSLGESPEAWRGAARMGLEVMRGIVEGVEKTELDSTSRFLLVFLTKFVSQPWAMQALEQIKAQAQEAQP
jgi:hypothetical protein